MNWLQRMLGVKPVRPAEMLAWSLRHPTTAKDWHYAGGYPFRFVNEKLGAWCSWRHTGDVEASVPVVGNDRRDLLTAMKRWQRLKERRDMLDAVESMVNAFEQAYGTE